MHRMPLPCPALPCPAIMSWCDVVWCGVVWQVLAASDPRSAAYSMPYIYEHFSWPHCRDSSFDIAAALKAAADTSTKSKTLTGR